MTSNDSLLPDPNPPTVPGGIPLLDETAKTISTSRPELLIITGMSGAGKSQVGRVLEDLDWYVVDNLPPRMLTALAGMMTPDGGGVHRLAAVVDVRSREYFSELSGVLQDLRNLGIVFRVLFVDADDSVLVRRFESVRRPHPLQSDGRIWDGIQAERAVLASLRSHCDVLINTSDMNVHDLARHVREFVAGAADKPLRLTIVSFGFKYGLPLDADHVVDVRFLANPYWVSELRHLTGKDEAVSNYVFAQDNASKFAQDYVNALSPVLRSYLDELKPYVTIAVGCTGGKHRSVAMTERISDILRKEGFQVCTMHRDLGRE